MINISIYEDGTMIAEEILENFVLYKALYGDGKLYLRPFDMFMSLADKEKYPQYKQKYRFEYVKDDYRYRPVKWDIKTNDFVKSTGCLLYIGELRIVILAMNDSDKYKLQFDIGNEETGYGISKNGVFFDDGGSIEFEYNKIIDIDDFKKVVLDHVYDYIETYKNDTLREKANSEIEINW